MTADYTQPGFWIAISVGGSLAASLSAVQQFTTKEANQEIRYKSILRDFCIGAFLTAALFIFLPESMLSWVSAGQSALSDTVASTITKISPNQGGGLQDIELQTGPALF